MKENGFNPMRWDCSVRGCFNVKRRPKIEVFCDCFKGNVSFGDVDGMIEVNGHLLILEWKSTPMDLPIGQHKMYERVTVGKLITVFVVAGNAETMEVTHVAVFQNGTLSKWEPTDLEGLKKRIAQYRHWASFHIAIWPTA